MFEFLNIRTLIAALFLLPQTVLAQHVSQLQVAYSEGKVIVGYELQSYAPADIKLSYSSDRGATWLVCRSVSGDLRNQTSGSKTVVWNCAYDDVVVGSYTFKVEAKCFVDLVPIKGGIYLMGCTAEQGNECNNDERTVRRVTVNDFYLASIVVTQAQWVSIMGSNPSFWKGDSLPVERVSWFDVQTFLHKLNAKTGMKFRLPTEAEWEYAARGGLKGTGLKYSGSNNPHEVAWFLDNSGSKTHPVAQKLPNELGLYDMSGNVYEWCSDWYSTSQLPSNASWPVAATLYRVYRGGSWGDYTPSLRTSFRGSYAPDLKRNYIGFRLAHSVK